MKGNLEVITIEAEAFEELVRTVIHHFKPEFEKSNFRWVSSDVAKEMLNISSDGALANYRHAGKIVFSQISKKNILYDRESIEAFIEQKRSKRF